MTRRTKFYALAAIGALLFSGVSIQAANVTAHAVDLPSWDDVQAAKADEAATASKVRELEGLAKKVADERAALEAAAAEASERSIKAQEKFEAADARSKALQNKNRLPLNRKKLLTLQRLPRLSCRRCIDLAV